MTTDKTNLADKPISEEAILKVAKEVAIKFIEVGRLTPGNFNETFRDLYVGIKTTIRGQ